MHHRIRVHGVRPHRFRLVRDGDAAARAVDSAAHGGAVDARVRSRVRPAAGPQEPPLHRTARSAAPDSVHAGRDGARRARPRARARALAAARARPVHPVLFGLEPARARQAAAAGERVGGAVRRRRRHVHGAVRDRRPVLHDLPDAAPARQADLARHHQRRAAVQRRRAPRAVHGRRAVSPGDAAGAGRRAAAVRARRAVPGQPAAPVDAGGAGQAGGVGRADRGRGEPGVAQPLSKRVSVMVHLKVKTDNCDSYCQNLASQRKVLHPIFINGAYAD